jgi:hypothetical protein
MVITTFLMPWTANAQTLVHEYSFSDAGPTNVADSIGGPAGNGIVLTGGTNALAGPGGSVFTGSQLLLSQANEDFVQLPAGILGNNTAVTIDTWVTLGTLPGACFLWGFGDTDTNGAGYNYIFCQPSDGRVAMSAVDPGWQGEQSCGNVGSFAFATPTEIHVTAVFNPPAGYIELYTNGVLAVRNSAVTVQMNQISNVVNYLGRSLYLGDGYYDSEWDEFRVWNGALNPLQVEACDVNGANNASDSYGTVTSVQFQLPFYQLVQGTHESGSVIVSASGAPNPVDMTTWASYSSSNPNILTTTNNVIYAIGQGSANIIASYGGISSTQTVTVVQPASVLTHRYSFSDANGSTTVADSVGGATWNGTVMTNGPTPAPYPGVFNGSQLTISSNLSEYVQLPSGIISNYSAVSIETWVTFPDALPGACFLWGFGNTVSGLGYNYIFFQPWKGYIAITPSTYYGEQGAGNFGNLSGTSVHVTAVFNPAGGWIAIYTNATLAAKNTAVTVQMNQVSNVLNYLCRSLYPGDQYMDASLDEFRIYNGALTPQGIAISDAAGPNSVPAGVTNGPGSLLSLTLQVPSTLQWMQVATLKLLANYTGLTGFDIVGNSIFPPAGLTVASSDTNIVGYNSASGLVTAVHPGTATITAVYQGITNSQVITVRADVSKLVHRYSFSDANGSTSCADSIGGAAWNGTVMSGGTNGVPTGGVFGGGQLTLASNLSEYVQLPSGILSNYTAVSVDAWVTLGTLPQNCMLWSFGGTSTVSNQYSGYSGYDCIFLQPVSGVDVISDTDPSWVGNQTTAFLGGLPQGTEVHVTGVVNPPANYIAIYTNGVLLSVNTSETIPMSHVTNLLAYLSRSLYLGDSFFDCQWDECRIYNGVLSPDDVSVSQALGPNQLLVTEPTLSAAASGANVVLSWTQAAAGFTLQSRTSLTSGAWTTVATPAALVGSQWQVTVPKAGGTQFFRLVR